jgi:hypothetical protein
MLGLLVAWRAFPALAGPVFSALVQLVHPGDAYS